MAALKSVMSCYVIWLKECFSDVEYENVTSELILLRKLQKDISF